MSRNVECKYRISAAVYDRLIRLLPLVCDKGSVVRMRHTDTYLTPQLDDVKRVKIREIKIDGCADRNQFIVYSRADVAAARLSTFTKVDVGDAALVRVMLGALCVLGKVEKTRVVGYVGQTRVHVDRVEGLYEPFFLELEYEVRSPEELADEAGKREIARILCNVLDCAAEVTALSKSYISLVLEAQEASVQMALDYSH